MTAIGDVLTREYVSTSEGIQAYAEAANWANQNGAVIKETDAGYEIQKAPEPTAEEKAERIRSRRDALLKETDYLLMADYPADSALLEQVKAYRQALRDLPEQSGFPDTVTYPTKPEGI